MSEAAAAPFAVPAVELHEVVKDFAIGLRGVKLRALERLSLRVMPGEIYGLLGPNGSGKSTAIRLLLGLSRPNAGWCRLFGRLSAEPDARRGVGYLPESPDFYPHLTGRELVRFYGRMGGMNGAELEERIDRVLTEAGLNATSAARRVGTYSKGMRQRIGLAQALVHDPQLLILDEPTDGLDPLGMAAVTELIGRLKARGKTILITSHLLAQMEEVCDRIAILAHGRLIFEGAMSDVVRSNGAGDAAMARPRARLNQLFLERVGGGGG